MFTDEEIAAYMRAAFDEAIFSPDPSTQNGAVLVAPASGPEDPMRGIIGAGCNTFPYGVQETEERLERPLKYSVVEHAERNAIFDAAASGFATRGSTLFALWAACTDCARAIIQAGVDRVYTHSFYLGDEDTSAEGRKQWSGDIKIAFDMFEEAGVEVIFVDTPVMRQGEFLLYSGEKVRY